MAIACASLGFFYVMRDNEHFAEAVERNFSMPVRRALGAVSAHVSFSLAELVCAAAVVIFTGYAVVSAVRIKRSARGWRMASKSALVLIICGAYIWSAFCWLWGIAYYTPKFSEKSAIPANSLIIQDELECVAKEFLCRANALAPVMARDEDGSFAEDMDSCLLRAQSLYDNIRQEFSFLSGDIKTPKRLVFSRLMSRMGFTGFYFPFTGETNINMDVPHCLIPSTIGHELAHSLGITSEQECDFLGIAACIASNDAVYEYSGYLSGLIYLMNTLRRTDIQTWIQLRAEFSEPLAADWAENNAYWAKMKSHVKEISNSFYDSYLKNNGQPLGMRSYNACVTMLVEYYK